jgi:glycosyltransferase involved in cell wall biosynthesis
VAFVIASLGRGGSEGQLVTFVSHAAARLGQRSVVATISAGGDPDHLEALRDAGVEVIALARRRATGSRRLAAAAAALSRCLRASQPDVLYAWGPHATLIAVPLAHRIGLPAIVARRQLGLEGRRRIALDRLVRAIEARAELVTANSSAVAADALHRGIDPERIRLVRNGHRLRERLPAPPPAPVVFGYVAGFRPGKGHIRLLDAIALVDANVPWRVDLAGSGPLLEHVRAEVHRRALGHRVRFLGTVRDVEQFWRTRHAAVLLSDAEGCANALIEAGLAGRPLLASAAAGNSELVVPGTGQLVPAGDPVATARVLERLIGDQHLRESLGVAAREHMRMFDVPTMAAGHLGALYEARSASMASTDSDALRSAP